VLRKKIGRLKYLYNKGGMPLLYGKLRHALYGRGALIEAAQLRPVYRQALQLLEERNGSGDIGDYLEFGVSQGTSMQIMYQEVKAAKLEQVRLYGFDSFEGMPASTDDEDEGAWSRGDFRQEIDTVKERLSAKGVDWSRVHLEKGWFENTCTPDFLLNHQISKAGVIMIDCDIYSSTKQALEFCEPLIKHHAVIVFDDWHSGDDLAARDLGEKKAFEEFLEQHPDLQAEQTGNYSCFGYANGVVFYVSRKAM
jgi:hypothetical protein